MEDEMTFRPKHLSKIKESKELKDIISDIKKSGRTIVLCSGVYDCLTTEIIEEFMKAKSIGLSSVLLVSVLDKNSTYLTRKRMELISSLEMVDYVTSTKTMIESIKAFKPDFLVVAMDYNQKYNLSIRNEATKVGSKLLYTYRKDLENKSITKLGEIK